MLLSQSEHFCSLAAGLIHSMLPRVELITYHAYAR